MTVALCALVPLLLALVIAVATVVTTLRRRAHAQALCVRQTSRLAADLGGRLHQLSALNARARRLRRSLRLAEKARAAAVLGGPEAVAVANALVKAIKLMQVALDGRQRTILAGAEASRLRHARGFAARARAIRAKTSSLDFGFRRALAVRPVPAGELAPEYVPVPDFESRQEITGSVTITIESNVAGWGRRDHTLTCRVSNEKEDRRWKPKIIAASAPSRPRWRRPR